MNKDNHDPSHFGLTSAGRDENGWPRLSADGGETPLPVPMPENEYEDLVADILGWMEQDELSAAEEARLRELLCVNIDWLGGAS